MNRRDGLTSQTVDGPLFELLERDICCGRARIEVQAVLALDILVGRDGELLFAVIEISPSFGAESVCVVPNHAAGVVVCGA